MDSKYANLPGIAHNEQDTYETPDVVETEQHVTSSDSDVVQKIEITTKEAYDKFSSQELISNYADFSDSISKRFPVGYLINRGDFRFNETPFQRYNRLLSEINDLKNDLQHLSTENKDSNDQQETDGDYDVSSLLKEVEKLQKNAATLHLETLSSSISTKNLDKQSKKGTLIDQLNEFKKLPAQSGADAKKTTTDNSIVFKIFNDIDSLNLKDSSKISDLNQRLSRIESIVDSKANKELLTSLTVNSENKTILGLVENLNMRINLVDNQSIEIIESKLQWMIQKLNQINEKKTLFDDNEKYNKVNELYSKLVKWQDLFAMFPKLIERLASLNELHQQASQFSATLSRLDTENIAMKQKLDANVDIINQIKNNLDSNLQLIRTNIENLRKVLQANEKK